MTEPAEKAEKSRYKDTVLLPRTDFPMKAGLQQREPELQKHWATTGLYERIRAARQGAKPWVLHDGPPYANGDAHTGTGMNKTLKDMVVKFRTMQGFDSPYVPGWDCHGLPIEHNVLKDLGGKKPDAMTSVKLREMCLDYANGYVDKQRAQFKTLGVLGRWEQPYLTTSPVYEANVLRVFSDLFARGFITRAKRPVHWSWAAQSALAEAELEYEDRTDPSVYVRFPVSSCGKDCKFREHVEELENAGDIWDTLALLIWTTTPWTLPANVAVAASQEAEYVLVSYQRATGDKREHMVLAGALLKTVSDKAKLRDVKVLKTFAGIDLKGVGYNHPFLDAACPVVFAEYVTLSDGTGLVHTAPGHGKEDFETGKREKLPVVCPIDEAGKFFTGERLRKELQLAPTFEDSRGWLAMLQGQNVLKANPLIVEKLRAEGWLLHDEAVFHSYPHCWRTHQPVIFRVTEQWFVNVDHVDADKTFNPEGKTLRKRLLDEIARTQWFPAWGEKRISAMIENRPDWCISRQRFWGIPIPAFADAQSGDLCVDASSLAHVVKLVEQHGSNVWYDDANWPVEKLLPDEARPKQFRGRKLVKMNDIFDVWFESGASHRSVMLADAELADKFPANMYLEGDDQHRGWFQVSLILSVATQGKSPFKQCLTSAFVVDEKGEKGSKSKGNIWAIDKGCADLGADLIRYYFASVNTSEPIPVTYTLIQAAGEGYRKLRNTFRALVGNLFDFDPAKDAVPYDKLLPLDRWALSQARHAIQAMTAGFDRYEFHTAMRALGEFANVTLSAQYVDVCKDRLYCEAADSPTRRSAQTAYWFIAEAMTRLLAPVLVHSVEDMWRHVPHLAGAPDSPHLAQWPDAVVQCKVDATLDAKYRLLFRIKGESDRVLDRLRKEKVLGKGYDGAVSLATDAALAKDLAQLGSPESLTTELCEVLNVSAVALKLDTNAAQLEGFEPAADVKGLWLRVVTSAETACARCYRRTGDVGSISQHASLCKRCAAVVGDRA
ncbi:MAG: isoleucine--tRNA ligase [Planctomycetes bacterium]|nr:isoleucine--tRNA ligase [Planctomycetota bacterium]